jgi:hypothetical protein
MPFLPSLIKRIDEFFKVAQTYSLVSLGADDKALLTELIKAAKEAVNPEVSYNLRILSAMYGKALEINGGFHTVYMALSSIIEDIDPDEEESEPVENLLNQIGNSIKSRAQRPDSPGDVRELQIAATAARGDDSPYSYDEPEGEDDNVSAYEASLLGYEGGSKAFEEEGGVSQFDMTGGVSPEAAQSGTGRGYSVGKAHSYKDWAAIYANEREKYDRDLNGPAELLTPSARAGRKDPRVQANLRTLVDVLGKLSALTLEAIKLSNQIEVETEVPHPEEARLAKIREELKRLERERRLLKRNLNKFYKNIEADKLREELNQPGISSQQRRILEQKLKLQELRTSGKYGYGKEAKERARLIATLTADPNLPPEQFKKMEEAINGAAQFTDRLTKAQYDRQRTKQQAALEGRDYVPTAEPMRGGGRYQKQVDFNTATYPALLKKFRELNNTITSDAKKYVVRPVIPGQKGGGESGLSEAEAAILVPYVDALSMAIKKKNNPDKFKAIKDLKEAIKQTLLRSENLRGYLWALRLAPHFKRVEEFLYNIQKQQDSSGAWNISEAEKTALRDAASQLQRMLNIFVRYFPQKGSKYGRSHYLTSVKFYPILIEYIYKNMLQEDPPSLETKATISKRLELLAKLMEAETLYKIAQEVGTQPDEIDEATADQLAQDIFNQLFIQEVQEIIQS